MTRARQRRAEHRDKVVPELTRAVLRDRLAQLAGTADNLSYSVPIQLVSHYSTIGHILDRVVAKPAPESFPAAWRNELTSSPVVRTAPLGVSLPVGLSTWPLRKFTLA